MATLKISYAQAGRRFATATLAITSAATPAGSQIVVPAAPGTGPIYAWLSSDGAARVGLGASPDPLATGAIPLATGEAARAVRCSAGDKIAVIDDGDLARQTRVLAGLATTLPASTGLPWLNGGVVQVS